MMDSNDDKTVEPLADDFAGEVLESDQLRLSSICWSIGDVVTERSPKWKHSRSDSRKESRANLKREASWPTASNNTWLKARRLYYVERIQNFFLLW
jgi:hypothetical protein